MTEEAGQAIQKIFNFPRFDLGNKLTEVGPQVVHSGSTRVDIEEAADQTWSQKCHSCKYSSADTVGNRTTLLFTDVSTETADTVGNGTTLLFTDVSTETAARKEEAAEEFWGGTDRTRT